MRVSSESELGESPHHGGCLHASLSLGFSSLLQAARAGMFAVLAGCGASELCPSAEEVSGPYFGAVMLRNMDGGKAGAIEGFGSYTGCFSSTLCDPDKSTLSVQVLEAESEQTAALQKIGNDLVEAWGALLDQNNINSAHKVMIFPSVEVVTGYSCGEAPPDGVLRLCVDSTLPTSAMAMDLLEEQCSHYMVNGTLSFSPELVEPQSEEDGLLLASHSFGTLMGLRPYDAGGFEPTVMSSVYDSYSSLGISYQPTDREALGLSCIYAGAVMPKCLDSLGLQP